MAERIPRLATANTSTTCCCEHVRNTYNIIYEITPLYTNHSVEQNEQKYGSDVMLTDENLGCFNNTVYTARESSKPLISKWKDGPLHECKEKNTFENMTKSCNCENCKFRMKTHQWEFQKGAVQSNLPDSHLIST